MIALLATLALAAPCPDGGMAEGPVTAGLLDGNLGQARRACPRTEASLGAGATLVADVDAFYGHIQAGATLGGSLALGEGTELFATFEALRYDALLSPFPSSVLGLGHTALGAGQRLYADEQTVLALHGKAVLPTAVGLYQHAWPLGFDLGLAWRFRAAEHLTLHANLAALTSFALSAGPALPRAGIAPTLGVEVRPWQAFGAVADLVGRFGVDAPVDVLGAALALRAGGAHLGAELGATVPLAGRERALATVDLRVTWRP